MPSEYLAFGLLFQYGNTADYATASTWTAVVAELTDIQPPKIDCDDIPIKHFGSTSQFEDNTAGWGKVDKVPFKGNFTPAEYNTLVGFHRTTKAYRITFGTFSAAGGTSASSVTGNIVKWNGYLKSINVVADLDGLLMVEGELTVKGLPAVA